MTEQNLNVVIEGFVYLKKFYNKKNDYYVLSLKMGKNKKDKKIVCGYGTDLNINDYVRATGKWVEVNNGFKFEAITIEAIRPSEKETILEYLSSGIIKGVGAKNAKEIVSVWGDKSLEILDKEPEQLLRITGIGNKKLQKIINSWDEVQPSNEIYKTLMDYGFQNFEAIRIYKFFKSESLNVVKERPYSIHKRIKSISFEKVDSVALSMGVEKDNEERVISALEFFLLEGHKSGDTLIDYFQVFNISRIYLDVDREIISKNLDKAIERGNIFYKSYSNVEYLQYRTINEAQNDIANRIYDIKSNNNHKIGETDKREIINIARKGEKVVPFSCEQKTAIINSINEKFSVLTGKPGAGKTSVLNEIIKQLRNLNKNIVLCAPTGKAAQKMKESTGYPSSTVHRLLEYNPVFNRFSKDESDPIVCDVLIIDESSMIDIFITSHLFKAISLNTQVIIVGDVNQLPSVGCGSVLRDIINSNRIMVSRLNKIYRQGNGSEIITIAHEVDKGEFDYNKKHNKDQKTDFYYLPTDSDYEAIEKIKIISSKLDKEFGIDPQSGLQMLTPVHDGILGTINLNNYMQNLLNPPKFNGFTLKHNNYTYGVDDKVIQIVNNYEKNVYNGDCGTIKMVNSKGIVVEFDNGMIVEYEIIELGELLLSYAMTIHKSQGSEYPAIIIAMPEDYNQIMDRSLVYTGITRGRKLVIVIGNKKTLQRAISSEKSRKRVTDLKEKINEVFDAYNEDI